MRPVAGAPGSDGGRQAWRTRWHWLAVPALLALCAVLAVTSLVRDSITYDETSHLTAGFSVLKTGDYRLAPDHPPLGKLWCAWPLLLLHPKWVPADNHGWQIADVLETGRTWLFELNDGEHLLLVGRCMMVVLLLALCGTIYAIGRRLFGSAAGLLALVLAVLSPTLLAHGRLVTTDVPITLYTALTLLLFARLLQRVTWGRLLATAAALGAASVSKMSWPFVLPALAVMAVAAVVRRAPIEVPARRQRPSGAPGELAAGAADAPPASSWRPVERGGERAVLVVGLTLVLALTTWGSIWTCYGWRASMFAEPKAGTVDTATTALVDNLQAAWTRALSDEQGQPRRGLVATALRGAADWGLLPDAYLYGLAWTLENTSGRTGYFCGQYATAGWRWYFPVAFAIKTPVAILALLPAGIVALLWRRRGRCQDPTLLAGLLAFVVIYGVYVINSSFNIGERHLLPIYPVFFVLAGVSATWLRTRLGRWLVPAALLWLAVANFSIYPQYLGYFNELVGGPSHGHRYLSDSNIDWGQDLKRLARYSREHGGETVKLSYFGSAVPTGYGFPCELLPSSIETGSVEPLDGGGLYAISVTHWLGVYDPLARDEFWQQPKWVPYYRNLRDLLASPPPDDSLETRRTRAVAAKEYSQLRWARFVCNLRRRSPDDRVGYSLFVYRLTATDIEALTQP